MRYVPLCIPMYGFKLSFTGFNEPGVEGDIYVKEEAAVNFFQRTFMQWRVDYSSISSTGTAYFQDLEAATYFKDLVELSEADPGKATIVGITGSAVIDPIKRSVHIEM